MEKKCIQCSGVMLKQPSDSMRYWAIKKYCGYKCSGLASRGIIRNSENLIKKGHTASKSIAWRGGTHKTIGGYIEQYISPGVYQLQHRYVMEKHIGRKLNKKEHVHHLNHDKTDNRIENLQILDIHEHGRLHTIERWQKARA